MGRATQDVDVNGFSSTVRRGMSVNPFKTKFDDTGTYTYIGNSLPGSAITSAVWQIKRITNADSNVDWADGDTKFDNKWSTRASASYS